MRFKNDINNKVAAGVLSSILSSLAWISEQEAVLRLSPLIIASCAPILAAVLIYLFFPSTRAINFKAVRAHLKEFLLLVIVRNGIGFYVFVLALLYTSSAKVMFLTKMEPYLVLAIHWLLYGEKIKRGETILLLVHVLGAILLSGGKNISFSIEQLGDVLVFVGLIASASVYRPGKKLAEELGPLRTTMLTNFTSGMLFLPFAILCSSDRMFSTSPDVLVGFCYLFVTVLLYYIGSTALWFYSLKGSTAWLMSALRCLGPIVAAPVAWCFFDRTLDGVQIAGAAAVILTSVLLVIAAKR